MVIFTEKVGISQQCQHYLSNDITDSLNSLSVTVSGIIYKGKTGEDLNVKEVKEVFTKVQEAELALLVEMQSKLKVWQLELDKILQI
jgi:hypothetical protein